MRFTGIVKPVDQLGRVVLPKELRRLLNIEDGLDKLGLYLNDDNELILKKYHPCCIFCNSMDALVSYSNQLVCKTCIEKLHTLKDTAVDSDD